MATVVVSLAQGVEKLEAVATSPKRDPVKAGLQRPAYRGQSTSVA